MKRGHLLVVEGLEGAGKSTAILTLKSILEQQGIPVITTREPGGTHLGEMIRDFLKHSADDLESLDARAELLLFYAARVQLLERVIKPALAQGTWVLADRCEWSSFAYQGGGRGLNEDMITHLSDFCVGKTQPDVLFYLEISPEEGLKRAHIRGKLDRIEQEPLAFFYAVRDAYQRRLATLPTVVKIDASQSLNQVQEALQHALQQYLAAHA